MVKLSDLKQAGIPLVFLFLLLATTSFAQYRITGIVTNEEGGEVLPGATVTLKETGQVTSSGPDGLFTFDGLKEGAFTVKADYVGFASQKKTVLLDGDVQIDLQLTPKVFLAEEVIIKGTKATDKHR